MKFTLFFLRKINYQLFKMIFWENRIEIFKFKNLLLSEKNLIYFIKYMDFYKILIRIKVFFALKF